MAGLVPAAMTERGLNMSAAAIMVAADLFLPAN
jgi:hypothetical protein